MNRIESTVPTWFSKLGEPLPAGANRPFSLLDGGSVWLPAAGRLEVFAAAPSRQGAGFGRRSHIATVTAGEILVGVAVDSSKPDRAALIAVGQPDTLFYRMDLAVFQDLATDPERGDQARHLVNRWLERFTLGFTATVKPAADLVFTAAAGALLVERGRTVRAASGMVWVRLESAAPPRLETIDLPASVLTAPFPLSADCRLRAVEALRLTLIESPPGDRSAALWQGLAAYQRALWTGLEDRLNTAATAEADRLRHRIDRDQYRRRHALEQLAAVVTDQAPELTRSRLDPPLLAACRLVGRHQGITMREANQGLEAPTLQARVEAIGRASRAGVRRVTLEGPWWRRDNGAILGFLAGDQPGDQHPVALLPQRAGAYRLLDPQTQSEQAVDTAVAHRLAPTAYIFYATFADRELTLREVVQPATRGIGREVFSVLTLGAAGATLGLLLPILTGILFDSVVPEASRGRLGQLTLILITCSLVAAVFEFTKAISILRLKGKIEPVIEAAVLDRVIALPIPFFRRFSTGDLTNRSLGICAIGKLLSDVGIQALLGAVFSSLNFILLFYYDARLALIAVGFTLLAVLALGAASAYQVRYQRRLSEIEGTLSGILLQLINGIGKLRVSGTEDRAFAVWAERFAAKRRIEYRSRTLQNLLDTFNGFFPILTAMAIFAYVLLEGSETFTTGRFIAFNAAYTNFQAALLQMAGAFSSLVAVAPFYERARPIFETLPEVRPESAHPGVLSGSLSVHQLCFRYAADGPLILDGVALAVEPGEFVAVVGSSGSGKSTLLRLLLGFEAPEAGTVYYDRRDLATLNVREVRRQIGVVLQNGGIMAGSIFQNIVGTTGMNVDAAWEAAEMVGLKEDLEALPQAMHTLLDPGGFTLSGGQRQRLLIARAIVRRPRLLFFDEATSALDNRTQALVSHSLERLQATRLVIAHRLSTIEHADRILVMDRGRIVEQGTYRELLDSGGWFTELARRQIA